MTIPHEAEDSLFDALLLLDAFKQLSNKKKIVLALRTAGYTQRECGIILGLTRSAIGVIHRATLRELRADLLTRITA